jgi:sialic acid synthase SpsE
MNHEKITSVAALVKALGGPKAISARFELASETAVYNWLRHDAIPPSWHMRLWFWCEEAGLTVDRTVFGVPAAA